MSPGRQLAAAACPPVEPDRLSDLSPRVVIVELFPSQVDQIARSLAESAVPTIAALLSGLLVEGRVSCVEYERRYALQLKDGALSRSVLRGFLVVACFLPEGVERGLSELSDSLELNIGTTHRYVATLVVLGVLEQDAATKKYRLPRPPGDSASVVLSQGQHQSRIAVELFPSQVDQIARSLAESAAPTVAALLSGLLADVPVSRVELEERYGSQLKDGGLSVSLLRGFLVLACFLPRGVERGISELADRLEVGVSTMHRYVATLVVLGVLEQNVLTKKYRLSQPRVAGMAALTALPPAAG
jgi:DNA-binding IclR family transcriptional regulator